MSEASRREIGSGERVDSNFRRLSCGVGVKSTASAGTCSASRIRVPGVFDRNDPGGRRNSLVKYAFRRMAREYPTVLALVGHTPLARLQRIVPDDAATVLAKLEYISPGGSVKDRIGIKLIEAAERDGKLAPGGTIVETTSGTQGVGLAIAATLTG